MRRSSGFWRRCCETLIHLARTRLRASPRTVEDREGDTNEEIADRLGSQLPMVLRKRELLHRAWTAGAEVTS